jgi:nucleotide-binding universal stress UspA family protein
MTIIVTAVDGSAAALKGARYAAGVARALGATLELAYVSPPSLLLPDIYPKAQAQTEAAEAAHAREVLDAAEGSVADLNVPCVKTRKVGGPAEEVADLAERSEVWGVVIGATGHTAVSRVLLGSVADRLVHISSKPVIVVR